MAILGVEDIETKDMDKDELDILDHWWNINSQLYTLFGPVDLYPEFYKEGLQAALEFYKGEHTSVRFSGTGEEGIGLREIMTYDVFGASTTEWDVASWTAGNRNWISGVAVNNGTFAAGLKIFGHGTSRSTQHFWAHITGVVDLHPSPGRINAFMADIEGDVQPTLGGERDFRMNEMQCSFWLDPLLITNLKQTKTGAHVETAGAAAIAPLGWEIIPTARARVIDITALDRPQPGDA